MPVAPAVPTLGRLKPARGQGAAARAAALATCCPGHAADAALLAELPDLARQTYAELQASPQARTAYELIDTLQPRVAQRIYPQTIYRTLAQLTQHGLVHRIASTNAYRACSRPGTAHDGIHFLCIRCGAVDEAVDPGINALLNRHADAHRFAIDQRVIEISGICARCSAGS